MQVSNFTIKHKIISILLFALLMWMAWPAGGFAPILFIAWLPLLWLEKNVLEQKRAGVKVRLFRLTYLAFILFNLATTWWIYFASGGGMVGAVLANSLLMAGVFGLFHWVHKRLGDFFGYAMLLVGWVAFEHLHMDWDLSWPWLNMGNGFAAWADMVQWYEYTGTQGGTMWILLVNILLFQLISKTAFRTKKNIALTSCIIILPILISFIIKKNVDDTGKSIEVVVVQPNIDPYNEKFSGMSSSEQINKILRLAESKITPKTKLVVAPETAIPDAIWMNDMPVHPSVLPFLDFSKKHPNIHFLSGLTTLQLYMDPSKKSATARQLSNDNAYYDAYNAATDFYNGTNFPMHYKSKLVPGVEKMPFPAFFRFFEEYAIDLGGTAGSLGSKKQPTILSVGDGVITAPVICYESIYGEYVGDYIRQGANLICIMTNDGWWENTPGHKQHCQYARLRAIETRKNIVRSANTGISCFINSRGELSDITKWWTDDVIRKDVYIHDGQTFYTRYGDYVGRIACLIVGLLLLINVLSYFPIGIFKQQKG